MMWANPLRRAACERGNVAIVVALAVAPMSVATLGAIDLHRATSAKVQLQDALDAAALGAARSVTTTDAAALQAAGARFLGQNLALHSDFRLISSSFTFGSGGKVLASARIEFEPFVAGLIDEDAFSVGTTAEVVRADSKLEIALVLDNTGSMSGSKLTNLKAAAASFVTTMQAAAARSAEADAVKIALVPFSQTVKVGTDYRYASWMDQSGAAPINDEIFTTATGTQPGNRFTFFGQMNHAWAGCVESRAAPYDIQDTPPTAGATLFTPYFAPDEPDGRTSGYGSDYNNDYVSDGTSNTNWRVRQGRTAKYATFPKESLTTTRGPNAGCGMLALRRLSTDYAGLQSAITNMNAVGSTNIPMGLVWGWHTLSPQGPFADGVAYLRDKHKKIVVLMTDGDNTIPDRDTPNQSTYAGVGYVWQGRVVRANGSPLTGGDQARRTAALDSRLALLCQNMKSAAHEIEIYAVRVEVTTGASVVLETCASSSDHYYDVQDAAQLTAVFNAIAGQIASLHLAR